MAEVAVDRGLTDAEVQERVRDGRVNEVPSGPSRTVGQIVRANVFTRFNALLGTMLVIILLAGPGQDALFGFVLIANAGIGIVQELRAKRTLDRLTLLTAPKARVVRDGDVREVAVSGVVVDDVVDLVAGSQVVVDGEVLRTQGLEIDESLLTGEPDPVVKEPGEEVLSGSFAAAGAGRYRATRVGTDAYAANLAQDARRFTLTHSELRGGIDRILRYVTYAIVPTAALLFVSQLRLHDGWRKAVSGAVAGTVAMVPEGLVLLTSLAFAVAVMRLARRRVLVQELSAVEGLARVDVLCIDKTGTLTEGRLAVQRVDPFGGSGVDVGVRGGGAGGDRRARRRAQRHDARYRRAVPRRAGRLERDRVGGRSPRRANGAGCRSAITARGSWGRPTCCWTAGRRRPRCGMPCARSPRPATASSCWRPPPGWTGTRCPARSRPPPW